MARAKTFIIICLLYSISIPLSRREEASVHARREEARKQRIVPRNVDPPRRRGIRKEASEGVDVQKKAQLEASP